MTAPPEAFFFCSPIESSIKSAVTLLLFDSNSGQVLFIVWVWVFGPNLSFSLLLGAFIELTLFSSYLGKKESQLWLAKKTTKKREAF